jgi:hypothetical protein
VWLRKTLAEYEEKDKSFDAEAQEKFGAEIDVCVGNDYEAKGKINTNIAVFKWDYSFFMNADELKKAKADKSLITKLTPPKSFDLTTAERVIITKEELKQREL